MNLKKTNLALYIFLAIVASVFGGALLSNGYCKVKRQDGFCGLVVSYFTIPFVFVLALLYRFTSPKVFKYSLIGITAALVVYIYSEKIKKGNRDTSEKLNIVNEK
jgi:ribose/xylose/arabinose/galactoside ABC-type transport system permease subunit